MTPETVETFVNTLSERSPSFRVRIDAPDSLEGETFIDIADGKFATEVSYKPAFGFGIYVTPKVFGQRPDELFRCVEKAVIRVLQLRDSFKKDGTLKHLTLLDMRLLTGMTQTDVANALAIKQPSVQRIEQRDNVQVETLAKHVHAMGGRLEMSVVFDDMEARLDLPALKEVG